MKSPVYDNIGIGYNTTRRADPHIASRLVALLQPQPDGRYLDIGCGTGNYMNALRKAGFQVIGVDPSDVMLEKARHSQPDAVFIKADAAHIPLESGYFDGAIAVLTLHHWGEKQAGLNELGRVIKPGGRAVFLSFTAVQMAGYWLAHYFPDMIKRSGELIPDQQTMSDMLREAGFTSVETEKYFVHQGLQDHFLHSNKYKPVQYLNPEVRSGISSFSAVSNKMEVEEGLKQLETDIRSGKINAIIRRYENDKGDYLFYAAQKGQ